MNLDEAIQTHYTRLTEGKGWSINKDGTTIGFNRFSGKTWPSIVFNAKQGKIFARDDNGARPSPTVKADLSMEGYNEVIRHISQPHPDIADVKAALEGKVR